MPSSYNENRRSKLSRIYKYCTYIPISAVLGMDSASKVPPDPCANLKQGSSARRIKDCMYSIDGRRRVVPFGYKYTFQLVLGKTLGCDVDSCQVVRFTGRQFLVRPDGTFVKVKYIKAGELICVRTPDGRIDKVCIVQVVPHVLYEPVAEILLSDKDCFTVDGVLSVALCKARKKQQPIRSFGIILYHISPVSQKVTYLVVRRRHTMAFLDFIRGKYFNMDKDYMCKLYIAQMTGEERYMLQHKSFDELWGYVWNTSSDGAGDAPGSRYHQQYLKSKDRWQALKIPELITSVPIEPFECPEYGWPKGRSLKHETPVDTALREFSEETGLDLRAQHATVDSSTVAHPLEEHFVGNNGIEYQHHYILVQLHTSPPFEIVYPSIDNGEIGAVEFRSFDDCQRLFRPDAMAKRRLLSLVHLRVTNALTQQEECGSSH